MQYVSVAAEYDGQRLDNFLIRLLDGVPKSAIYRMIRRGEVRINRGRKGPHYRVRSGDELRVPPRPVEEEQEPTRRSRAQASKLLQGLDGRILYEDDDLLILNKPHGLAVHGGSGIAMGLIEALREHFAASKLELIHRIDRDTSGCVAVAKHRRALLTAQAQFREQRVKKRYELLVEGVWPARRRRVDLPLDRWLTRSGERRVRVDQEQGKPSRTDFQRLRCCDAASWLQATPHTGRTHQIRVHAAQLGHPLLGDDKYGSDAQQQRWRAGGIDRLCLHAERLRLELDGRDIDVRAPVPPSFEQLWQRLS